MACKQQQLIFCWYNQVHGRTHLITLTIILQTAGFPTVTTCTSDHAHTHPQSTDTRTHTITHGYMRARTHTHTHTHTHTPLMCLLSSPCERRQSSRHYCILNTLLTDRHWPTLGLNALGFLSRQDWAGKNTMLQHHFHTPSVIIP